MKNAQLLARLKKGRFTANGVADDIVEFYYCDKCGQHYRRQLCYVGHVKKHDRTWPVPREDYEEFLRVHDNVELF